MATVQAPRRRSPVMLALDLLEGRVKPEPVHEPKAPPPPKVAKPSAKTAGAKKAALKKAKRPR